MNKTKLITVILSAAVIFSAILISGAAEANEMNAKCKTTVNGESVTWQLEPFQAAEPLGNAIILIPMRDFFTALGYTVTYDSKFDRSVFTANKESAYDSFYVDIKTGDVVKKSGKDESILSGSLLCVRFVYDSLYVTYYDGKSGMKDIAEFVLNGAAVKIEYGYVHNPNHENFMYGYKAAFPIKTNLSSLTVEVLEKYPEHPYVGEQYTKYNTGDWVSGAEIKRGFDELTLRSLWDGFGSLHFYTGKGEENELTGKGTWNSTAYSIAWELMDAVADEINRLRKQNGLPELTVDNSMCFVSAGTKDTKINSVFDNAIHNIEINMAYHTYSGKTKYSECMASATIHGEKNPSTQKYNNSTSVIAGNIADQWYRSSKGHKDIIMGAKYKTMGVLVIVTDTCSTEAYAVFK